MPPFQSRSTGAQQDRLHQLGGVIAVTVASMPSASATSGAIGIDLSVRGNTPPPSEISSVS